MPYGSRCPPIGCVRIFLGAFKFLMTFQWDLEQGVPCVFKKAFKTWFGEDWRRLRVCTHFSWSAQVWDICSWVLDKALPCFGLRTIQSEFWKIGGGSGFALFFLERSSLGHLFNGFWKRERHVFYERTFQTWFGEDGRRLRVCTHFSRSTQFWDMFQHDLEQGVPSCLKNLLPTWFGACWLRLRVRTDDF